MMLEMPVLQTPRLRIRPFLMADLPHAYRLFDVELAAAQLGTEKMETLAERAEWLQWSVLNYGQLAKLNQPPYGDRAIILKSTNELIGSCGFVPCLNAFAQVPGFAGSNPSTQAGRNTPEFGLFYAISPAHHRRGYATEAAQALVDYAFQHLNMQRIVATTDYDNAGSIGVMRKLGMRIAQNSGKEPPWLQIVGVIDAPPLAQF